MAEEGIKVSADISSYLFSFNLTRAFLTLLFPLQHESQHLSPNQAAPSGSTVIQFDKINFSKYQRNQLQQLEQIETIKQCHRRRSNTTENFSAEEIVQQMQCQYIKQNFENDFELNKNGDDDELENQVDSSKQQTL